MSGENSTVWPRTKKCRSELYPERKAHRWLRQKYPQCCSGDSVMAKWAYDAIIIGSGPNGLAAAITMARTGRSVLVLEAEDTVGGGLRSAELTLPGFIHDVCSAIHVFGIVSPFFRSLPLAEYGIE